MQASVPDFLRSAFERKTHPFLVWEGIVSIPGALAAVLEPEVQANIVRAAAALHGAKEVHLIGCGTSLFAALAGASALSAVAGVPAAAHNAFEFAAYPPAGLVNSALLAISHTGGTPVVSDAVEFAAKHGAVCVGVTDVPASPVGRQVQYVLADGSGREPSLPKTRSYVTALLRLYLLALAVAEGRGRDTAAYRQALDVAPPQAEALLASSEALVQRLVSSLKPGRPAFLIGAGPNVATVSEGALKLQETAQVPALAWELEEAMHGPWVSINPGDLVVLLALRGPSQAKALGLAAALRHIGATLWVVTDDPAASPATEFVTVLPAGLPEYFTPLYAILPLYRFAYGLALAGGRRPDAMRLTDEHYLAARLALPR